MVQNTIQIKDNSVRKLVVDNQEDINNLSAFLDKPIYKLAEEEHLLIFPHSLHEYGDELGGQTIGSLKMVDKQVFLSTGNIMGFVGKANTQLHICSRFGNEQDDYFLFYMLFRVLSINVFDLPYSKGQESALDLLMLLFPSSLSNAMQQGIYREYRTYKYNDPNVRGVVDINRHIQKNIPYQGNIAYKQRERSVDNPLTQLIRHTIEYMRHHPMGQAVLEHASDIRNCVSSIVESTPTYSHRDRTKVINENLRPKVHPYYSEYRPLQRLCLQILRQEDVTMGVSDTQMYGILFDGAWLWEEYLDKIICEQGFVHPRNKEQKGGKPLFKDGSGIRYPDFYNPKTKVVLDAKYKSMGQYGRISDIDRNDLHQVISYMYILQSRLGGYLYPSPKKIDIAKAPESELYGYRGVMKLFPFFIPKSDSWNQFVSDIAQSEKAFQEAVKLYCSDVCLNAAAGIVEMN